MRTRSQQASPGGFLSLEDRAPRRTRSTRSASTSQPNTESATSTQATTRARSQGTVKKTATSKATKTQTRKASQRVTRKSTRKTVQQTTSDNDHESDSNEEPSGTTLPDDKENLKEESWDPVSVVLPDTTVLSEPKSSSLSREYPMDPYTPQDPYHPPRTPPHQVSAALSAPPPPPNTVDLRWYQYQIDNISDIGSPLSERSRTPSIDGDDIPLCSDLPFREALIARIGAALVLGGEPSTSEPAVVEPTATEWRESAAVALAESTTDDNTSEKSEADSTSTFAADSKGGMVAEFEQVEALVEKFSKFAIADFAPCSPAAVLPTESPAMPTWFPEAQLSVGDMPSSGDFFQTAVDSQATAVSGASVHTLPLGSIFSDVAPVCPSMEMFGPPERVQQRPLTLFDSIPVAPSSIYDEPYSVGGPLVPVALAEEPELIPGPPLCPAEAEPAEPSFHQSTPSTRAAGLLPTWFPAILSPIPEESEVVQESELSAGPCCSSAGTQEDAVETSTALLLSPTPRRSHQDSADLCCEEPKLTDPVNRKRSHEDTSDEDRGAPVTPAANKRRNLGPPGSTPFTRRRTPLSRRIQSRAAPFSARLARREAEKQGRIESTLFRLPEYLRQLEADRRKAEQAPSSPAPPLPQTNFDFTMEPTLPTNQGTSDESSAPEEPSTPERDAPETPQRGWNLRGLLSSVPRSFSRLLPFGRSSGNTEAQATIEPSSERIIRTRSIDTESTGPHPEIRFRRRLSDGPVQLPKKQARNLSYSLFPAPIDRSLYLGDVPKPPRALSEASAPDLQCTEQEPSQKPQSQHTAEPHDQTRGRETSQAASEPGEKKRKRSPSPDVIPNPAGSSYGMDLDYFCYSSDSEDEVTKTPSKTSEIKRPDDLAKTATRSALRSERPSSKKVRFDASPENTPSKLRSRARATDPYCGTHFMGMGSGSASAPTTPTPPAHSEQPSQRPPGFIPNTQGTFQLDYDAFSDDSESSGPSSPASVAAPSLAPATQPEGQDVQSPASHQTRAAPSTPGKVDGDALARVRSQAEKYKPKTPSGLRTTSRYSSPLTAATPDAVADKQAPQKPDESAQSEQAEEAEEAENFGDDEFARDAEWLYQNCPSGDLSQLEWPARQSYEESLGVSATSMQLLATIWDDSEIEPAYLAFRRSFEEFKKTLQ